MATAPDFHILISAKAREGTYQVRLYSVPASTPVMMYTGFEGNDHWNYIQKTKPVTLDSDVITAIGPQQIDAESELEQGNPRYASVQIDLLADPALQAVVENMRDQTKNIWCEITLFQNLLDEPARPQFASLTWPKREKLFFWGFIDRKSSKGKVNSQRCNAGNFVREDSQKFNDAHNGEISFVFFDWRTWSNFQNVKALLDVHGNLGTGLTTQSCGQMMASLMGNLCPTNNFFVCDQEMLNAAVYASSRGFFVNPFSVAAASATSQAWGKLPLTVYASDNTAWDYLSQLYISDSGALWYYDSTQQVHTLTSDQAATSLYHWNDLAQALTEWCREFFFDWQCELPTLSQAATLTYDASGIPNFESCSRFLLLSQSTTATNGRPLAIVVDPLEQTLEYDPCGAWASSYTVSEPTASGLLPDPAKSVATSQLLGGSDESYTTLLRLCGWSYQGGVPTSDPRGWEIYVENALGVLVLAVKVQDNDSGFRWTEAPGVNENAWSSLHALRKITRWGSPRAIVTMTSKGVGLEAFGQSAYSMIYYNSNPNPTRTPITAPTKTYGLRDFSDFPLGRQCLGLPGIMATPGDSSTSEAELGFSVISIKRTPNGDTELKMIEVYSDNIGVPLSVVNTPPPIPPGPPPPPPQTGTITP